MSNFLYVIHPKDVTTDFLEDVYNYLLQKYSNRILIKRLKTRDDHHEIFGTLQGMSNDFLYLFLGHGTSTALSGAITKDFEYPIYISENQLQVFEGKNIVLLSCRSNQFLKAYFKQCNIKSAIGFPNMITDKAETEYPEPNSIEEVVTVDDITAFRAIIVNCLKYSLEDYIVGNFSPSKLFDNIRLRIHRKLINFYREQTNKGCQPLGLMLSELSNDITFLGN